MSSSPSPASSGQPRRWTSFAICASVASFAILDLSKVNVGLPSIERALAAGPTGLQLVVAGYALAFGLVLVPAGRYGDMHSRRTLLLVGVALFVLGSLVCAVSPSIEFLVAGRLVQGFASGIMMPQVFGLIQQLFSGPERGAAFGLFGTVIGLSTAFGPTLGGVLIAIGGADSGWRLLFWMNVPLGLVILPVAFALLPRTQPRADSTPSLDLVGVALLGVALLSLMAPFVLTTGAPSDDPRRWLSLLVFAAVTLAFVLWERRYTRRGRTPILDFALIRISSFAYAIVVAAAFFAAIPSTFLTTTLLLQQGLGLEPVFAGMITVPFALASACASWYSGRLVARFGRRLVIVGLIIVIVGFASSAAVAVTLPAQMVPWAMAATMLAAGIGGGTVVSPNQTLMLSEVPQAQGGVAGSLSQLGQRIGTAVGLAATSAVFFAVVYGGGADSLEVYRDAYGRAALVTISFLCAALLAALLDVRARARVLPAAPR